MRRFFSAVLLLIVNGNGVTFSFAPLRPAQWRRISNERQRNVNDHVSAQYSLLDVSLVGRNHARNGAGKTQHAHSGAYSGRLGVRNASAYRAAIGIHHPAPRCDHRDGRPHFAHVGSRTC